MVEESEDVLSDVTLDHFINFLEWNINTLNDNINHNNNLLIPTYSLLIGSLLTLATTYNIQWILFFFGCIGIVISIIFATYIAIVNTDLSNQLDDLKLILFLIMLHTKVNIMEFQNLFKIVLQKYNEIPEIERYKEERAKIEKSWKRVLPWNKKKYQL
jgi:hypothetical protein